MGLMSVGGSISLKVLDKYGQVNIADGGTISKSIIAEKNGIGFFAVSWHSCGRGHSYSLKKNGVIIPPDQLSEEQSGSASWCIQLKDGDEIDVSVYFTNLNSPGNVSSGSMQYIITG